MNTKLSDDAVADLQLHHGRAELLEEIIRTPVRDDRPTLATPDTRRRTRWVVPAAAAATVAVLVGVSAWWATGHDQGAASRSPQVADAPAPGDYRAVLEAPGWAVDYAGVQPGGGGISYSKPGGQTFEISSYPAKSYDSYVEDRRHIVDPPADGEPVEVLGRGAQMWAYSRDDHTAIRRVEDGHWLELRGSGMGARAYVGLLGRLRLVDHAAFEAALPDPFVSDDERAAAIDTVLEGIDAVGDPPLLPAGVARSSITSDQTDPYQLGADLAGGVACAWLDEFSDARLAGDQARARRAVDVLATSRHWPVLLTMDERGDYPEVVWGYADQVARGEVPEGYDGGLGC